MRKGISTAAAVVITAIIVAVVVAGITYAVIPKGGVTTTTIVKTVTSTTTTTVGGAGAKTVTVTATKTVTTTVTTSVTPTATKTVTASPTTTTSKPKVIKKVKVAVLFDVGGRGDLSFNDMAWLGAQRAAEELGAEVTYLTPKSLADMVPLLEQLAKSHKYDILVLIGFLWTTPLNKTASKFPDQKFALIDATTGVVRPNEVDILFREQECASLIGVLAAGIAYELGGNTIAALAGMDIPPLWKFHIGYLFGAKYFEKMTGKKVNFLWVYTGTFRDPAVGKQYAMQLIQKGAKVIYGLAGATHLGMFEAVKEWDKEHPNQLVLAIGQDASQEWIDPYHIILSGAKRVDVAVYTAIKMVATGTWKGGIITLGLKEGGVGIWDLNGVKWFAEQAYKTGKLKNLTPDQVVDIVKKLREKYIKPYVWNLVKKLEEMIISGKIVFKTPRTHDEYMKIIKELEQGNLDAALAKGHIS